MNNNTTKKLSPAGVTTEPCCPETPQAGPRFDERVQEAIARSKVQAELSLDPTSLSEMVQEAIAAAQIPLDTLSHAIVLHIPTAKYTEAKPYIKELTRPGGGSNITSSEGYWWDPVTQSWVEEQILLIRSYMAADVLKQHLETILLSAFYMGRALQEQAIALEILSPQNQIMVIIPCG